MRGISKSKTWRGELCWLTWNLRMMVQMRPRVNLWLLSTMSCEPMFSRCTLFSFRNWSALSTFSKQWMRILPFVGLGCRNKREEVYKLLTSCHYYDYNFKSNIHTRIQLYWQDMNSEGQGAICTCTLYIHVHVLSLKGKSSPELT